MLSFSSQISCFSHHCVYKRWLWRPAHYRKDSLKQIMQHHWSVHNNYIYGAPFPALNLLISERDFVKPRATIQVYHGLVSICLSLSLPCSLLLYQFIQHMCQAWFGTVWALLFWSGHISQIPYTTSCFRVAIHITHNCSTSSPCSPHNVYFSLWANRSDHIYRKETKPLFSQIIDNFIPSTLTSIHLLQYRKYSLVYSLHFQFWYRCSTKWILAFLNDDFICSRNPIRYRLFFIPSWRFLASNVQNFKQKSNHHQAGFQ